MFKHRGLAFLLLFCMVLSRSLAAEEPAARFDQVNLSAQASMEVDNDNLIAVLYSQQEGSDTVSLSERNNFV